MVLQMVFGLVEFLVLLWCFFLERPTSFPIGALGVYRNKSSVVKDLNEIQKGRRNRVCVFRHFEFISEHTQHRLRRNRKQEKGGWSLKSPVSLSTVSSLELETSIGTRGRNGDGFGLVPGSIFFELFQWC